MSILYPFASAWARTIGFRPIDGGMWQRGAEVISTDTLIKRYQASIK